MKHAVPALALGVLLLSGCQSAPTDDPEKLKAVLTSYFDGIKNKDHQKMIDATTSDFQAFEEGKVYNNDSVFKDMDKISPYTATFKFDTFRVSVDQTTGHMSYYEHAEFLVRDTIKFNLNFVGSAAMRKEHGTWKMYFMQATRRYARKKKK